MDYLLRVTIALIVLLSGAFALLYFLRPIIYRYANTREKLIVILEQQFLPKTGTASLLRVCGEKYLIVSNSNSIAISRINEKPEITLPEDSK